MAHPGKQQILAQCLDEAQRVGRLPTDSTDAAYFAGLSNLAGSVLAADEVLDAFPPSRTHMAYRWIHSNADDPVLMFVELDVARYEMRKVHPFTNVNGVSRTRMASLNPTTGAVTSYLNVDISGAYPKTGGAKVYNSQLSNSGDKLLIEGVFTSIKGQPRQQAAVLDLGATTVGLDGWTSSEPSQSCYQSWYVRAGAWSPDDRLIYFATTGYKPTSGPGSGTSQPRAGFCDAAVAFPATAASVSHLWVNYSGCDSYYSVAADADNVYVSGHERWANNPNGCDVAGPGAVSRPGIASMDPRTGLVTGWNPTRSLGVGSHHLLVTGAGLWVASDTWKDGNAQMCGGQLKHGGICFLPY